MTGDLKGISYTPFAGTIKYIQGIYGINGVSRISADKLDRNKFSRQCESGDRQEKKFICTREEYLKHFRRSSDYFIERGFSPEVLQRYDVRHYTGRNYVYYNRSLIPVYDDENRWLLGFTSRTECNQDPKWLYSKGFPSSISLFNYNFASEHILKSRTVIVVESPLNVLRLEEAGIHNSVCIWSATGWNDYKRLLLDKLGVMRLVLALDNDNAGRTGTQIIKENCSRLYNTVEVKLPDGVSDVADLSVEDCKQLFQNIL